MPTMAASSRAWRLGTGIVLVTLGMLVLSIQVRNAHWDAASVGIAGMLVISGTAMIGFNRL